LPYLNTEYMLMRAELIEVVETELRRFGTDLNLSDTQKTQLKAALENAHEKIEDIQERNPNITRADVASKLKEARGSLRERVVKFLTPEQLTKWDQEVTKAKTFLGTPVES
jgi:periplasmic protein CpxP/Spy